jgi:hypothetical protein
MGRKPEGKVALTNAQKQARYRERQKAEVNLLWNRVEALMSDKGLAEHMKPWCPAQRAEAAELLLKSMDTTPTIRWGTRSWLIARMINKLSGPELVEVAAVLVWRMGDNTMADFVEALTPVRRKRLAAALANRPSRRATVRNHTGESQEVARAD